MNDAFSHSNETHSKSATTTQRKKKPNASAQVERSALRQISKMRTSIVKEFLESKRREKKKQKIMTQKKLFNIMFKKDTVDCHLYEDSVVILRTKWAKKKNPLIV